MILLKPRRSFNSLLPGLPQVINVFTKNGIGKHALDPVSRDCLQNNPWILSEFPQYGIKRAPNSVCGMVPRPAHVQSKLCQRIKPFDFRRSKAAHRVDDASLFAHGFCQSHCRRWRDSRSSSAVPPPDRAPGPVASDHITTDAIQPDGLSTKKDASGQSRGRQPCPYNSQES